MPIVLGGALGSAVNEALIDAKYQPSDGDVEEMAWLLTRCCLAVFFLSAPFASIQPNMVRVKEGGHEGFMAPEVVYPVRIHLADPFKVRAMKAAAGGGRWGVCVCMCVWPVVGAADAHVVAGRRWPVVGVFVAQ